MRRTASVVLLMLCGCSVKAGTETAGPASQPFPTVSAGDSASAHAAAVAFLAAFDSLQLDALHAYFAPDVSMFFPFEDTPARVDGRDAVAGRFRQFFDAVRSGWASSGRTGPARLGIVPRDLLVQHVGTVAVVSFHLGGDRPARRSLVFHWTAPSGWLLSHWHASPPPSPPPR